MEWSADAHPRVQCELDPCAEACIELTSSLESSLQFMSSTYIVSVVNNMHVD